MSVSVYYYLCGGARTVCVCVYVCVCVSGFVWVSLCVCLRIVSVCVSVCVCVCVGCVCACVRENVCAYLHARPCDPVCSCAHACLLPCTYVWPRSFLDIHIYI